MICDECGHDKFGTVKFILTNPSGVGWHPACLNCGKMIVSPNGCGWRNHDACNQTGEAA